MFKYGVIPGPYFPVFGLNTEIYGVNIRIQSEYTGKCGPEVTLYLGTFHVVALVPRPSIRYHWSFLIN